MDTDPFSLNRATYDQIAPKFAEVNKEMPPNLVEAANRLLNRLGGQPGCILDLGCGPGRDLAWFLSRGVTCVGADLSRGMLAQARMRIDAPLAQMDMRMLGFASGSFAAVWCSAALLHLPKALAPAALAEMKRVLLPGGQLFLSMQVGSSEGVESNPYTGSDYRFFSRYPVEEMTSLLERGAFRVLQVAEDRPMSRHWMSIEAFSA